MGKPSNSAETPGDEPKEPAKLPFLDLLDVSQQWHKIFIGVGIISIIFKGPSNKPRTKRQVVIQLIVFIGMVFGSVWLERILERNVMTPLLDYLFGKSAKEEAEALKKEELRLRQLIKNLKQKKTNRDDAIQSETASVELIEES